MIKDSHRQFCQNLIAVPVFLIVLFCSLSAADLKISFRERRITDIKTESLKIDFYLSVFNAESRACLLYRYHYRVRINGKEFFNMAVDLDQPISIPARKESFVSLPLKITYDYLFQSVGRVAKSAYVDVTGEMFFRDEKNREDRASFSFTSDFPIFLEPQVEFLPLQIRNLTLAGAEATFQVKFSNPNPYELLIDRICFKLFFVETEIMSSSFSGDKNLPANSQKTFSLPLVIDFFDVDPALKSHFSKNDLLIRFEGQMEIASAWGKLVFSFDRKSAVPVKKIED